MRISLARWSCRTSLLKKSQAIAGISGSDSEMQRFESFRPSQPVRLQHVTYEGRSKTARYREVSQI